MKMIPQMPPLIPLNLEQIEKIESTQRDWMKTLPLHRQLWMKTKHSNILAGSQCDSESHRPNALNAFVL